MSKAVLISIRPQWCEKIASGEKTIEVRKTRPKLETPFKCYIYCTKNERKKFWTGPRYSYADDHSHNQFDRCGNGKVIGEFVCDRIAIITYDGGLLACTTNAAFSPASCLSQSEIVDYIGSHGRAYGWYISGLKIYDEPKGLGEFTGLRKTKFGMEPVAITRPFQSWGYVEELL